MAPLADNEVRVRVRANHQVYESGPRKAGSVFVIDRNRLPSLEDAVEIVEDPLGGVRNTAMGSPGLPMQPAGMPVPDVRKLQAPRTVETHKTLETEKAPTKKARGKAK